VHEHHLIFNLTIGLTLGLILGFLTNRLRLSPIPGYLIAGTIVGPHTPGVVADTSLAAQFAEIGVILLMFGVGLHFHLRDLLAHRRIIIGTLSQSLCATLLGASLAVAFGWKLSAALVLGAAISVASTVVMVRNLTEREHLATPGGKAAVAWVIVEDILVVVLLVLLPALGASASSNVSGAAILKSLGIALLKLGGLAGIVLFLGSRFVPWLLFHVARSRSKELFTLTVLVLALVTAAGSAIFFGASMALGAFLAGIVVGQSSVSHQAAADALPMRDAFAVLFFVSVGMLFRPELLLSEPWLVLGVLGVILIAKPVAMLLLLTVLGYSVPTGITVGLSLAQIGEFSFILGDAARKLGILPGEGQSLLVTGALISITLNPLLYRMSGWIERQLRARPRLWRCLNRRAEARGRDVNARLITPPSETPTFLRVVVVGYGPAGQTLVHILKDFGVIATVIDLDVDAVSALAAENSPAIYGDARQQEVLRGAGVDKAGYLLVTLPDMARRTPVILGARAINPDLRIFVRARHISERDELEALGVTAVTYEEAEVAVHLAEALLSEIGAEGRLIQEEADKIRAAIAVHAPESL